MALVGYVQVIFGLLSDVVIFDAKFVTLEIVGSAITLVFGVAAVVDKLRQGAKRP